MTTPVRDAKGRFAAAASKPIDAYKPDPDVWVRFSGSISARGCGNITIYGMQTAKSTTKGESPYANPHTCPAGTPYGGIRLTEILAYLKKNFSGRELDLTFVHYTGIYRQNSGKYKNGKTVYTDEFVAGEFMELLDHTPEAKRVHDWFNTNHNPPSHLRSYSIVFPAIEVPQDFLEMKK